MCTIVLPKVQLWWPRWCLRRTCYYSHYNPGAKWELSRTTPDGQHSQMTGQSIEVVRRQPDGRWLYAIDLPFGAGA